MKRIETLILLLFAINAYCQNPVFVKDSLLQQYTDNGYIAKKFQSGGKTDAKKLRQGMWVDYKVEKDFMCYTEDGVIKQLYGSYLVYGEGNYYNGKRAGAWKFYVLEDKTFKKILQQEAFYKNGSKEGVFTYFLPNGKTGVSGTYHLDKIDGTFTNYYASGAVYCEHDYSIGVLNGLYVFYYEDGKVKSEGYYTNNIKNGPQKQFYHTGKLKEVFMLSMGAQDGLYQYFYTNGQLSVEREYKAGLLMNVKANFTAAGAPREKGSLKKGNGTVLHYDDQGNIITVQTFKGGKLISEDKKIS